MITIYAFVMAALLPNGQLIMDEEYVSSCPDKVAVNERMQKLVDAGEIVKWNAICFRVPTPNESNM